MQNSPSVAGKGGLVGWVLVACVAQSGAFLISLPFASTSGPSIQSHGYTFGTAWAIVFDTLSGLFVAGALLWLAGGSIRRVILGATLAGGLVLLTDTVLDLAGMRLGLEGGADIWAIYSAAFSASIAFPVLVLPAANRIAWEGFVRAVVCSLLTSYILVGGAVGLVLIVLVLRRFPSQHTQTSGSGVDPTVFLALVADTLNAAIVAFWVFRMNSFILLTSRQVEGTHSKSQFRNRGE